MPDFGSLYGKVSEPQYLQKIRDALNQEGMQKGMSVLEEQSIGGVEPDLLVSFGPGIAAVEVKVGDKTDFLPVTSIPEASYFSQKLRDKNARMVIVTNHQVSEGVRNILTSKGISLVQTDPSDAIKFVNDFRTALEDATD